MRKGAVLMLVFVLANAPALCAATQTPPVAPAPQLPALHTAPPRQPNIVLILADDLGSAELGCTGSKVLHTPHIDALRARGISFTAAYSGAPVCAPSRCILLTGRDSLHAQIRDNGEMPNQVPRLGASANAADNQTRFGGQRGLQQSTQTLATILRDAGYATGCFGKWGLGGAHPDHLQGHPLHQGFDRFFGYLCQRNAHSYWPEYLESDFERCALDGNSRAQGKTWAPHRITAEALAWMQQVRDQPFLLYFPSIIPHLALQAPEELVAAIPDIPGDSAYDGKRGYQACARPRATYTAMVQRLDEHVGQLVATARNLGILQRTVFIVLSDNGATWDIGGYDPDYFRGNAALRGHKGQVYEGGLRIPFIASLDGATIAASTCTLPVAHQDILPTLCALAGAPQPKECEGTSLAAWIIGGAGPSTRAPLAWEFPQGAGAQAVRMGQWKGVRLGGRKNAAAPLALYDLAADPAEAHDVAAAHSDIVAAMLQLLAQRTSATIPDWDFPEVEKR